MGGFKFFVSVIIMIWCLIEIVIALIDGRTCDAALLSAAVFIVGNIPLWHEDVA